MSLPSTSRLRLRRAGLEALEPRLLLTGVSDIHDVSSPMGPVLVDADLEIAPAMVGSVMWPSDATQPNSFPRDALADAEGESDDIPILVRPIQDEVLQATTVTLEFEPLPGYTGNYLVRLDDLHWNGQQASGFQHDSNLHYLSISTKSTSITLPVEAGEEYRWWVHKPGFPAAGAGFSVAEVDDPPPSSDIPTLVQPQDGDVVDGPSVTLEFEPLAGYTGNYLVRLDDLHWDGRQASGFQHDSDQHYLSIETRGTQITLPVEAGEEYRWWVHKPGHPAAGAGFSVAPEDDPPPSSDVPTLVQPAPDEVVDGPSVTLEFEPLPGYTGNYLVRLEDLHWDGQQAAGFQHDSDQHYLSISTRSVQITVPVQQGEQYEWWVHKPGFPAARASFSVAEDDTPPSSDVPTLVQPAPDEVVDGPSVTLVFDPLPGYTGNYLVRMDDLHWNGSQAPGFQHDSNQHYLSIETRATQITLPVEAGEQYHWWVHKPGFPAAGASFSVAENDDPPSSDVPNLIQPVDDAVVQDGHVTLEFEPLPGYTGDYLVRLDDLHWNGQQASGFQHDSGQHYLSIATKATRITLPVELGEEYNWWVHKPGYPAAGASFSVGDYEFLDPVLVGDRYRCTAIEVWNGTSVDVSPLLQHCINQTPIDATLELPVGKYQLSQRVDVDRRIELTSVGKSIDDPTVDPADGDAAHLIAHRDHQADFGMFYFTDVKSVHHLIFDGNKGGRQNTPTFNRIVNNKEITFGFNAMLECDDVEVVGNVFQNALAGSGLGVRGARHDIVLRDNSFVYNGVHNRESLWADGVTIWDVSDSEIIDNEFVDNTDIDLIFGGARNTVVRGNTITHTANAAGGAFAGLMIHKWAGSSGDYSGSVFTENIVDGGPNRNIGSGIYVASEGWYQQTPYGSTAGNPVRASIHGNVARNVQNGMYIAAHRFDIYENQFENAHGVTIPSSCGNLYSNAPIVVSPTSNDIDFRGENTDPATRHLFESQSWIGCIPNWPF